MLTVSNGKIIDAAGKPWIGAGINTYNNADPATVFKLFPKINLIRCATRDLSDPAVWDKFIAYMTARNVVCEIEYHPWPLLNAASGQQLTNVATWYGNMAARFRSNAYVIFGSPNEPQGGDITTEHVAVVNAIRNAGNNALILLMGGEGGGNPGAVGPARLRGSAYTTMKNVGWGLHLYGRATGYSTDQTKVNNLMLGNTTDTGIKAVQSIRSADGLMPVVIDEFGPSTSGAAQDGNADQIIKCVTEWAIQQGLTCGYAGWNWDADPFNAVQSNGVLTAWGTTLANAIKVTNSGDTVIMPTDANLAALIAALKPYGALVQAIPDVIVPPPTSKESADKTLVSGTGGTINASPTPGTAGEGNIIAITADGKISLNGAVLGGANVDRLYYTKHTASQRNTFGNWYGPITKAGTGDQITDPTGAVIVPPISGVPAPASAVGYNTRTYGPNITIGKNWKKSISNANAVQNADGTVTIAGPWHYNDLLTTLGIKSFGGGGYFEFEMYFDNEINGWGSVANKGWPAGWVNSEEGRSIPFPDNCGPEIDIAEFMGRSNYYSATTYVWYDRAKENGNQAYGTGDFTIPNGSTGNSPHKYGWLWVPATKNSKGYSQFFFDRVHIQGSGDQTWDLYDSNSQPPYQQGSTFLSVLDVQHVYLMLGSGEPNPIHVKSWEVWQKDDTHNTTY